MGRRRYAAILTVSVVAHLALFAVWMAARPPEPFTEPPVMQVTLIAPPHAREAPRPRPVRTTRAASGPRAAAAAASPAPPPPPHLAPPPPAAVTPRVLSEDELLAGRNKNAAQVREALNRRRLASPWDGCRQMPTPDGRTLPCPTLPPAEQGPALAVRDASGGAWAGEAAAKRAMRQYRESQSPPGQADAREFPGFNCTLRHRC